MKRLVKFVFLALVGIVIAGLLLVPTGIIPPVFGVLGFLGLCLVVPLYFTFFTDMGGEGPISGSRRMEM